MNNPKAIIHLLFVFVFPAAHAVTHIVGGTTGWTTGYNYTEWASGLTFTVGDEIQFNFVAPHLVDEVSQGNFESCNAVGPITSSSTSPLTIDLNTTGIRYFICPVAGHCSGGQSLAVTVRSGSGGSTPPSRPSAAMGLGKGSGLVTGLISLVLVTMWE